jgi:hypothetical protein
MTLSDVAKKLHQLDDDHTIYAKRNPDWSAKSEAVLCETTGDNSDPPGTEGLDYFLEVDLAKETVQVWSDWRDGQAPTTAEKLDAMIYYAEYDAWLPLDGQKPIDPNAARENFIAEHGGFEDEKCRWHDCPEKRVKGLAFCYEHYCYRPSS